MNWKQHLEDNLGDDAGFATAFDALKQADMSLAELKQISKEFYGATARSKAQAYRQILSRHQNLMDLRARAQANGGRAAA